MALPQLLTDIISKINQVPSQYIRPESDRPNLVLPRLPSCHNIPLIDLEGFDGPNRRKIVEQIRRACMDNGFFQVKNHGMPEILIKEILGVSKEFFQLPESERLKSYSDDPTKAVRLSTSFNVRKEKVSNWRDFLRLHCYPLEDFIYDWPANPPYFRKVVSEYCKIARALSLKLLEAISESLGLEKDYIEKTLGKQGQHMAFNYYPPCPEPELTYGLPGHTDPNALTILLQDQVQGLQVLNKNKWIAVDPIPNTFVVNIGDQIQVISNGLYKSVLHRAVVNNKFERISIPTFYCPSPDALIEPAHDLVCEKNPLLYRSFTYREYFGKFWDRGLRTENCLDLFNP